VSFILGAQDQMTPPAATKELAALLKPRITRLPNCGHHLLAEAPEATRATMQQALGGN
jgi:pimeloyl-ACP methyl ester carboxylesterase